MNPTAKKAQLRYSCRYTGHMCALKRALEHLIVQVRPLSNDADSNDFNEDDDGNDSDNNKVLSDDG